MPESTGDLQDGRVAIVTGGSSGIGRAVSQRFLSEGIHVAILSRNPDEFYSGRKSDKNSAKKLLAIRADVTDLRQVEDAVAKVEKQFGRIDILVNCAGSSGPIKPLQDITLKEWTDGLLVDLTGTFISCKCVIPKMIKGGRGGRIINMSSMVAKRAAPFRSCYSSAKLAVIGLTRSLSAELGPHGITVNAVCPGPVEGDRIEQVVELSSKVRKKKPEELKEIMIQQSVLRRLSQPEEVAALVSFLCSKEAYAITGQDLNINSGSGV